MGSAVQELAVIGGPLHLQEKQAIAELPGVPDWQETASDWQTAAKTHATPQPCAWDVFISHTGNSADKPFARALKKLLKRTSWGLRVFLDDDSLQPGDDSRRNIMAAIETTAVAVLLLSTEYFEREATAEELQALYARHAQHRVQLLPVFLRMSEEDCKCSLAAVMAQGTSAAWLLICGKQPCTARAHPVLLYLMAAIDGFTQLGAGSMFCERG